MREREKFSAEELRKRAEQAKTAAENLFREIKENPSLLEPSSNEEGNGFLLLPLAVP